MATPFSLIDPEAMGFDDATRTSPHGGTFVALKSPLLVQFGENQHDLVLSKWGLSKPMPGADDTKRRLEFEPTPADEAKMRAFDEHVAAAIAANTRSWFKKDKKLEYKPMLNERDGQAVGKVKVVCAGDKPTEVFRLSPDKTRATKTTYEALEVRGCKLLIAARASSIWFNATQVGVSFTALAILVVAEPFAGGLAMFQLMPGVTDAKDDDADDA